jgi:hypothetical protein
VREWKKIGREGGRKGGGGGEGGSDVSRGKEKWREGERGNAPRANEPKQHRIDGSES